MRTINKGREPASLAQHRCVAHADYDNYTDKDTLRISLVTEQRGICCYCLTRIRPSNSGMKIEHWHCRDNYSGEQLDYKNLIGRVFGRRRAIKEAPTL
jgi:uncharacterized protein (TIGR02646 family)